MLFASLSRSSIFYLTQSTTMINIENLNSRDRLTLSLHSLSLEGFVCFVGIFCFMELGGSFSSFLFSVLL